MATLTLRGDFVLYLSYSECWRFVYSANDMQLEGDCASSSLILTSKTAGIALILTPSRFCRLVLEDGAGLVLLNAGVVCGELDVSLGAGCHITLCDATFARFVAHLGKDAKIVAVGRVFCAYLELKCASIAMVLGLVLCERGAVEADSSATISISVLRTASLSLSPGLSRLFVNTIAACATTGAILTKSSLVPVPERMCTHGFSQPA